jgi:protein TonB
VVEGQPLQRASGRGWKIGVAVGAASLIAFAAYGLWPRTRPAQHTVSDAAAAIPEPEPEPSSVAAAPLASPVTPTAQSLAPTSAEPRASADDEVVEPSRSERGEREREEREERDEAEPSAPSTKLGAADEAPSVASERRSSASITASPTASSVLRVTPAPGPAPRTEPLPLATSPRPAPAAAAVPPPAARPAPAAPAPAVPARGPTRDAVVIEQVIPKFPARARRLEVTEGTVALEYTVDKTGAVKNAVVVSANPPGVFDDAALAAIQRWRYEPRLQDGAPVETRKRFKFTFR